MIILSYVFVNDRLTLLLQALVILFVWTFYRIFYYNLHFFTIIMRQQHCIKRVLQQDNKTSNSISS